MAYNPTAEGTYEVSSDGGTTFQRIFNITGFALSGGDREETTTDTLDEGATVSVGPARPKDVSITANANPGTAGYRALKNAYDESKSVQIRVQTKANVVLDNATATRTLAIATSGVVTGVNTMFSANSSTWQIGRGIVISNTLYVIESVASDTSLTVSRADGAAITSVSATDSWDLVDFGVQYTTECQVLNAGNPDLSPGSPYSETFTLKTTGASPDFSFITS